MLMSKEEERKQGRKSMGKGEEPKQGRKSKSKEKEWKQGKEQMRRERRRSRTGVAADSGCRFALAHRKPSPLNLGFGFPVWKR
jgi:hypothetical protein